MICAIVFVFVNLSDYLHKVARTVCSDMESNILRYVDAYRFDVIRDCITGLAKQQKKNERKRTTTNVVIYRR